MLGWLIGVVVVIGALWAIAEWRSRIGGSDGLHASAKIQRIKAYRERFGVGLKEARTAIEAEDRGQPLPPPERSTASAASADVEALAREGRIVDAIKLYRKQTGASLQAAKAAVDRLRR